MHHSLYVHESVCVCVVCVFMCTSVPNMHACMYTCVIHPANFCGSDVQLAVYSTGYRGLYMWWKFAVESAKIVL